MIKASCSRCGDLHTERGLMLLTSGPYCRRCIGSGWPDGAHLAVGEEFAALRARLFHGGPPRGHTK